MESRKHSLLHCVNKRVDEIQIPVHTFPDHDYTTFGQAFWNTLVVPRLECNLYRKRFVTLQMIEVPSTRTSVVAIALARVAGNPFLLWMLLSQNHGVLASYLGDASIRDDSVSDTTS
jgi:hypothetical protein